MKLLDKDDYSPQFVEDGGICMQGNAVKKGDTIQCYSVVHIPIFKIEEEFKDLVLIHEIGHALELELLEKSTEDNLDYKMGLEYFFKRDEELENGEKRKFEKMNETFRQKLAIEITKYLHSKGIFLIGDPKKQRNQGNASYEIYYELVKNFYTKYKQDIIDAMTNSKDYENFITKFSEENINKLNELVRKFSVLPHNFIIFAQIEGRVIPETLEKQALLEQAEQLMVQIEKHLETKASPGDLLYESLIEETEGITRSGMMIEEVKSIKDQTAEELDNNKRGEK